MISAGIITDTSAVVATESTTFDAKNARVTAVHSIWTATTASFTLTLQSSIDNATWTAHTTATTITDASGNVLWQITDNRDMPYWRVLATRTSGTLTTLKTYIATVAR